MKLSEMSTDKAMEVMANMLPAISRVMANKKVAVLFAPDNGKETDGIKFFFDMAMTLLKECKDDAAEIIGILCEKTAEQVKKQNFLVTAKDIMGCYDKELADFFTSFKRSRPGS